MRKCFDRLLLVVITLLFFPSTQVSAQYTFGDITRYKSLADIVNAAGGLVRFIVIITFVIALMIGGWTRMTSAGDPEKIMRSRQIITAAIIGFVIIVLAPVITDFLGRLLGVEGGLLNLGGAS